MEGNSTPCASKRLATIVAVMTICLGLVAGPQSYGAGSWPNEPAGFSVKVDCAFSDSLCPPLWNAYNTATYQTIDSAPFSPSKVFNTYLSAGSSTGNGQWGLNLPNAKELYLGTWWSTNVDFVGLCNNGNKMLSFGSATDGDNSFLFWQGFPGSLGNITWLNQTNSSNAHVDGWDGDASGLSGVIQPTVNPSAAHVRAGSGWHRLEVYLKSSTTLTSRDGILRVWVDGSLVINVTNMNKAPHGLEDFQINHTWDGSYCLVAPQRDMSKRWDHYWDHLRVSVGQGSAPADQPPGPPASPRITSVIAP